MTRYRIDKHNDICALKRIKNGVTTTVKVDTYAKVVILMSDLVTKEVSY
jgi:hypothetical protein